MAACLALATLPDFTRDHGRFVPVGARETRCYAAPAVRIPSLLYGLALLVRALLIWHFPDPAYPDSAYLVDAAEQGRT